MAEREGFREYVVGRHAALVRTAWLLTGDLGTAEDLVQVALLKTWRRWGSITDNPDAYVRKVMVNTSATWWRRRWRAEEPHETLPEHAAADEMSAIETRHEVMALLASLPRRQRAVVVLRYYQDLSEEQTAELLGCTIGTVKSHASRGLAAMRVTAGFSTERVEGQ